MALFLTCTAATAQGQTWTTYAEIGPALQAYETAHPTRAKRYDLGLSVQGRHLWALRISDNVALEEDEPECKYISTMHGDEIVGVKMCMNLIDFLLINYGVDSRATNIINEIDLWIVPLMNPDGYDTSPRTRYNANGVDLNRDFPDPFTSPNNTTAGRALETAAIMNWSFGQSFTLSANFHGGALVVNYPYDNNASGSSVYTICPDDDLFIAISEAYSSNNLPMWNSGTFFHGITNGAAWYAIDGGMQDWNYLYMGGNEVTIELGNTKQPSTSQITTLWNDNRNAMLSYLEKSLIGLRGKVTDSITSAPLNATIDVIGRTHSVFTDPQVGDYHRMLLPGVYDIKVTSAGHDTVTITGQAVPSGNAVRRDLALGPPSQVLSPNGGETLYANQPTNITWSGNTTTAYQVQYCTNYGASTMTSDGFEAVSLDPAYTTGGNANWLTSTTSVHSGARAGKSGTISHGQISWLQRTVGSGSLSFWYRVSSEGSYDFFNFYIDGVQQVHASGNVGWTQFNSALNAGSHLLRWEYVKDTSVSTGSDTTWIDDLVISQDATSWSDVTASTAVGATSTLWTPTTLGTTNKVRVRALYGANATGAWDESNAIFSVQPIPCVRGDMDHSGFIDGLDIAIFVKALLTSPTADEICRGDFNSSGGLDAGDVSGMINALLGGA